MKMRFHLSAAMLLACMPFFFCARTATVKNGAYTYETVKGDPLKARIYTLENGLKVYMTVYKDAPRIATAIPVRVGSKNDPATNTGLAHYLEHLLFKGTDEIGTSDFQREKPLLDRITSLYEMHRAETDSAKRREIYQKIDSVSFAASKFAVAVEYDKMLALIGADGTNAFTSSDVTCYINDVPSNHIRQWLRIEAERFRDPVFRLFHTELEVVYEEKNRSMDNDYRKRSEALNAGLWPTHPYGTQTTLGSPEHLKNPSLARVYDYFRTWYVPNNMAVCLSGDFDPDSMIVLVDETLGRLEPREISATDLPVEAPIAEPVVKEVLGPDMESIVLGFRFPGSRTREAELLLVSDWILSNGTAGILDLNLRQKQLVLDPSSGTDIRPDYSAHVFSARPREGQSLEQVRDLLLAQVDSLKAGAFPDWLPGAAVKHLKLNEIRGFEDNWSRAFAFVDAFVEDRKWEEAVEKWGFREKITKKDIVDFANRFYGDNYIAVYKRTGRDPNVIKIQKPPITPVELNRDVQSGFLKSIEDMKSPDIQPVFIDFQKDLDRFTVKKDIPVLYKRNFENEVFSINFLADMGQNHDRRLATDMSYLTYLGTSKYTAEQFKQEMFKLGCSFSAWSSEDETVVSLSGLAGSYEKGLELLEHLLADAQPDSAALANLVRDILKRRADSKLNKGTILNAAMFNYATWGKKSPFTNILSGEELASLKPSELTELIKGLNRYPHRVLYYGPLSKEKLAAGLDRLHRVPEAFEPIPEPVKFEQVPTEENKVFVCDYDMKQAEMIMLSRSVPYDRSGMAIRALFNEYYGGNMSSVVFQTLRESKALAYSVWGAYLTPDRPERAHYIQTYIGTQADKIDLTLNGMFDLLNHMPETPSAFSDCKEAIVKRIQTERITKENILWTYEQAKRMGNDDRDHRADVYEQMPAMTLADLKRFFSRHIQDKKYSILVLGDVKKLDFSVLNKYGKVTKLSLEEVFGY